MSKKKKKKGTKWPRVWLGHPKLDFCHMNAWPSASSPNTHISWQDGSASNKKQRPCTSTWGPAHSREGFLQAKKGVTKECDKSEINEPEDSKIPPPPLPAKSIEIEIDSEHLCLSAFCPPETTLKANSLLHRRLTTTVQGKTKLDLKTLWTYS